MLCNGGIRIYIALFYQDSLITMCIIANRQYLHWNTDGADVRTLSLAYIVSRLFYNKATGIYVRAFGYKSALSVSIGFRTICQHYFRNDRHADYVLSAMLSIWGKHE